MHLGPHRPHLNLMLPLLMTLLALLTPAVSAAPAGGHAGVIPTGVVSGVDVGRIPGVHEAVGRSFDAYETQRSSGIGHLEFAVFAFPDAETARTAMPHVYPALTSVLRQDARSIDPPPLGDEALAWTAVGPQGLRVGVLLVRDGIHLHLLTAVAATGDPLDALEGIAARTVGRVPRATPAATPASSDDRPLTSGGLWDLLPRYDDLPGEFGLYVEESWPVPEPPGVPPAATPADCTIEPRPRSDLESGANPVASPASPADVVPATPATPGAGTPADAATIEAVTATMHEHTACLALGDWPRAWALVTDRYLNEQLAELTPELIDFMLSGDVLPPVAEGPRLVEVRDVEILPDGRIGAVVETVSLVEREEQREITCVWLVRESDRYLIDDIQPME